MAKTIAERSTCTRLHVGAVAAIDGRILSTGYNGAPVGMQHCTHPSSEICQRAVHAEANLVAFAARHGVSLVGAQVYCTSSPCYTCACLLINAGIKAFYFLEEYRDLSGNRILSDAGVSVYHVTYDKKEPYDASDSTD